MDDISQTPQANQPSPDDRPFAWSEDDKKRLIGYIDLWRGLMLMNGWHINVEFSEKDDPDDTSSTYCSAQMHVNLPYQSGHCITIYPKMITKEPDYDEQERKIVHELAHIITQGQRDLLRRMTQDKFVTWTEITNENERETDWIANILVAMSGRAGGSACTANESSNPT